MTAQGIERYRAELRRELAAALGARTRPEAVDRILDEVCAHLEDAGAERVEAGATALAAEAEVPVHVRLS